MNEKRIQQVLEIEQQAQAVYNQAVNEAKQLPIQAEQEAQVMVDKARADAQAEAKQMLEKARSEEESQRILDDAQEKIRQSESLAQRNMTHAVTEVLNRVVGKE